MGSSKAHTTYEKYLDSPDALTGHELRELCKAARAEAMRAKARAA